MFNRWQGYSPYGNRFLFTGREWLADLRLYDYRNRLYQPELGRFMQPDPKEFTAGDYNLYRYCHNDPVNKTDPTGLQVFVQIPPIFLEAEIPRPLLSDQIAEQIVPKGAVRIPPRAVEEAIRLNREKNSVRLPDGRRVDLRGR